MTTLEIGRPIPGFYRLKKVRGGVWVPCLVYRPCPMNPETGEWIDRWYPLRIRLDGRVAEDYGHDVLMQRWPYLRPISEKEYTYLVHLHEWARKHAPHLPEANPREAVDLGSMEPIF